MLLKKNLLFIILVSLGILLPDLILGHFSKILTCRIPLTTLLGTIGFAGILSFVNNRWILKITLSLAVITQIIQVNHWAYFGVPIHSQDISKVFFELDEILQTGNSLTHALWPVWLTLFISGALLLAAPYFSKGRVILPYIWIIIPLVLSITPLLSYIKGPSFFYTKPTYSTIYNTIRSFSDWLVRAKYNEESLRYKPYTITYNKPKIKNIVLIVGESLSSRYMHLYGYKETNTPFLYSLRKDKNFLFSKGISSSVSTRTCLQLLFNTYLNPGFNELIRKKDANLFRLAKHQGYKTFILSAQNEKLFHDTGTEFVDLFMSEKDMRNELSKKGDEALLKTLSTLELSNKNFIVIHLRHIHSPFNQYTQYLPTSIKPAARNNRISQTQEEYSNAIIYHDHWVQQCLMTIKKILPKDTIVLFTSDHGQLVGERGLFGHNQMQPEVADVPFWALLIKAPSQILYPLKDFPLSHYDLAKYISTLFGATISNPNENQNLQYVHGSEILTNYEFMPWKKIKGNAIFLKNQWIRSKG